MKWVEPGENSAHLRLCLSQRDAGAQAPDGAARVIVSRDSFLRRHRKRHPDIGRFTDSFDILSPVRKGKTRRHHADDSERLRIEQQCLSQNAAICAEAGLPERMADHRDTFLSGLVVIGADRTAKLGRDAQRGKKFPGDRGTPNPDGRSFY